MRKVNLAAVHQSTRRVSFVHAVVPRFVLVQLVHVILLQLIAIVVIVHALIIDISVGLTALLAMLPFINTLHVVGRVLARRVTTARA